MTDGEEGEISQFIEKVFAEHIDPFYSEQGRLEFRKYIDPSAIGSRSSPNHFRLVAESADENREIIGIVEIREYRHVCLLFVDSKYQRRGVGKRLLREAFTECKKKGSREITVNSSPNAVPAYQRFGFEQVDKEKEMNGIRFVPMKKFLTE